MGLVSVLAVGGWAAFGFMFWKTWQAAAKGGDGGGREYAPVGDESLGGPAAAGAGGGARPQPHRGGALQERDRL